MASNSPIQISSLEEHNRILASQGQSLIVHFFWADWSEPCRQIDEVIDALAREYSSCTFVKVEAERYPDVTEKYPVRAVPSFVFVKGGRVLDTVEGANVPAVVAAVKRYSTSGVDLPPSLPAESTTPPKVDLNTRLEQLVKAHRVMLFMKGTPDTPRCGFSREMINLMKSVNVQFGSFDILKDDEVRQGLKAFSNWPTYPQLYVDGKLIGGLDICKELQSNNELADIFPEEVRKPDLNTRLHQLINKQRVMIFIKGTPQTPQCGFSARLIEMLASVDYQPDRDYGYFNILADEEVRSGLKVYSNWPTYPQVYVGGNLVGGLDILNELLSTGDLLPTLSGSI